jgi:hypothetical protein
LPDSADAAQTEDAALDAPGRDAGTDRAVGDASLTDGGYVTLKGDIENPQTCDAMCKAIGRLCGSPDSANSSYGGLATWGLPDGGEPCGQIIFCFSAPEKTNDCSVEGSFEPLVSYECTCWQP